MERPPPPEGGQGAAAAQHHHPEAGGGHQHQHHHHQTSGQDGHTTTAAGRASSTSAASAAAEAAGGRGAGGLASTFAPRLSLGWSLAAAFATGALAYYAVRYFLLRSPTSTPNNALPVPPPSPPIITGGQSSGSSASATGLGETEQREQLSQRMRRTLDRTTLASRERVKQWLDRVGRRQSTTGTTSSAPSPSLPLPRYYDQGPFEGIRLKRRLLPPSSSSSSSSTP